MKRTLIISFFVIGIYSCVSKKKFAKLEEQNTIVSTEKANLEDLLGRITFVNDSLIEANVTLDSLLEVERDKNYVVTAKEKGSGTRYANKKSNINKDEEYSKKAAFVYNFTTLVSWPPNKSEFFIIGVLGHSHISSFLNKFAAGKFIGGKKVIIMPLHSVDTYCHILFVGKDQQKQFQKIKKSIATKPTLIITENVYLNEIGGHISFYIDKSKVSFLVNKYAIEKHGLLVSASLMSFSGQ